MPQLDPAPWLMMFLSSWALLIWLSPMKISKFLFFGSPSMKPIKTPLNPWLWPWL